MSINRMPISCRSLISMILILSALITACLPINVTPNITHDGRVRFENGVVQIKNANGVWAPVAGTSTFELVGGLESVDPWTVAGRMLETNELTQIEEGLSVGDVVRVQGAILEDDTWVAYSIQAAEEQAESALIVIGIVDSIDPWVVHGITLNITDTTDIQDGITVGMIVRVEIMILPDGTWAARSIALVGDVLQKPGCVTVIAKILSVEGDQIQFEGWPVPVSSGGDQPALENNNDQGEGAGSEVRNIEPGRTVMAVVCISADGQLVVVQILPLDTPDENDNALEESGGGEKVLVCHNASKNNPHTISIAQPAVPAHLAHGDTLGPCP